MPPLIIKIVQAKDLKSADSNGFSDPYVVIKKGSQTKKTKIVKRNLNPAWNEQFTFDGASGVLEFQCMDWDRWGSHDALGTVSLDLKRVEEGKNFEEWLTLEGKPKEGITGAIHVIVYWSKKGDVPVLQPTLVSEGHGQLFLSVLSGHGLAAKDRSGTSDPYCVVKFNNQKYKTSVVQKSLDPEWQDADYYFEVPKSATEGTIEVLCYDYDVIGKDDSMGKASIKFSSLSPDGKVEEEKHKLVPLKKEAVSGTLKLRVAYVSSEFAIANEKIARENFQALLSIIQARDVVVVSTLCQCYQSNEIAALVVSIFESHDQALRLINQLLFREIKATQQETTLFRTDSMATKVLRSFLRLLATDYLRATIGKLIGEVTQAPKGYEVDPNKVAEGENVEENMRRLLGMCKRFIEAFVSSRAEVPAAVRFVLGSLKIMVEQKFPDSAYKAVGGFWFLRFACPAIFSPDGFNLVPEPPSKDERRALTLISKVLQNISNGVMFGKKEPFMESANDFVSEQIPVISQYFQDIAEAPTSQIIPSTRDLSEEERVRDMSKLVRFLNNFYAKIVEKAPKDIRVLDNAEKAQLLDVQLKELGKILGK